MWSAARDGMKREATDAAGSWVWAGFRWAVDKFVWGFFFLLAVYWVGGAPALVALLKVKLSTP